MSQITPEIFETVRAAMEECGLTDIHTNGVTDPDEDVAIVGRDFAMGAITLYDDRDGDWVVYVASSGGDFYSASLDDALDCLRQLCGVQEKHLRARIAELEVEVKRLTIERDAYRQLWDQACARLSAIQDAVNGKHDVEVA